MAASLKVNMLRPLACKAHNLSKNANLDMQCMEVNAVTITFAAVTQRRAMTDIHGLTIITGSLLFDAYHLDIIFP